MNSTRFALSLTQDQAPMDTTATENAHSNGNIDSDSVSSEYTDTSTTESPPLRFKSNHRPHARSAQVSRGAPTSDNAAFVDSTESETTDSRVDYTRRFCDSQESEPPQYHSLNTVHHTHPYPAVQRYAPAKENPQEETISCTTSTSYRWIEGNSSPESQPSRYEGSREIVRDITERLSEAYLLTLGYCGIPVIIKPQKAAVYTIGALIVVNSIALILSWAALFSVDPSPSIITYSLTLSLVISCVISFFVFWAHKLNPFAAISAFASTAFSGTFVTGVLNAFFVANNFEKFEDANMSAIASAAAAFDIIAAMVWFFVIITALNFYTADYRQRRRYVMKFIAFNALAVLVLVSFLFTLLMDITFFDKVGQTDIMYLVVGFSILSLLFSLCFCFCTGLAIRERETTEHAQCSKCITFLPFAMCAILAVWAFICGILSMVMATNLSHDSEHSENYGGSVAALVYLVGTLNFGVAIATISVGFILGVHTFM